SFSLSSTKADGLDGFGFYYNMKQIERKMFNGLSLNLKGTIHFGATVNHFENMSGSMQMDIEILSKKAANAITYDIENSVVERKIKIYEGLSIEFTIFAIFSNF
uniref:Apolipoprotein B n=1 Tax=Panagrolaimus sp. PS1159 TaxID=55785 RepID=A0AC35FZG4_9BILA